MCQAFFTSHLKVKVLKPANLETMKVGRREDLGMLQFHAGDILKRIKLYAIYRISCRDRYMPNEAFCLIAITTMDLYPDDEWAFCYGLANVLTQVPNRES